MLAGEMLRAERDLPSVAKMLDQERAHGAELHFELLDEQGRQLFPSLAVPRDNPENGSIHVSMPIHVGSKVTGQVRVIKPTVVIRAMLTDFAPTVLLISLVLGAAAALAAALIGQAIARPIERLTGFAVEVSEGVRSATVPAISGGREVDRLALALDSMRRQLEGRPFVETFAADLSHELKNPVAAIRASAEVLEEGALEEPLEARKFVRRIRQASDRIERLLKDLLALARIEARGAEALGWVDVGESLENAILAQGDRASRIEVTTRIDARLRADGLWLARAFENLLDNALLHSPADSKVSVSMQRKPQSVVLCIENDGEIPARAAPQIFRRFMTTRADRGGTGLGLAIVRAVAEAHGGHVDLAETGPPKVVFRLELPRA